MPGDLDQGGSSGEPLVLYVLSVQFLGIWKRGCCFFGIGDFFLCGGAMEQGGMHITEPLQFFDGSTLPQQFLLGLHNCGRIHILTFPDEIRLDTFQSFSVIQTL